jgi:hypothetical protein
MDVDCETDSSEELLLKRALAEGAVEGAHSLPKCVSASGAAPSAATGVSFDDDEHGIDDAAAVE